MHTLLWRVLRCWFTYTSSCFPSFPFSVFYYTVSFCFLEKTFNFLFSGFLLWVTLFPPLVLFSTIIGARYSKFWI